MTMSHDDLREPVRTFTFPRQTLVSLLVFAVCWEVLSHLAPVLGIPPFAIPSLVRIAKSIATITPLDTAVIGSGLGVAVTSLPASAYPSATVSLVGHGYGHGHGMGQWGALGYALSQ